MTIKFVLFNNLPREEGRKGNTETRSCKCYGCGMEIEVKYDEF